MLMHIWLTTANAIRRGFEIHEGVIVSYNVDAQQFADSSQLCALIVVVRCVRSGLLNQSTAENHGGHWRVEVTKPGKRVCLSDRDERRRQRFGGRHCSRTTRTRSLHRRRSLHVTGSRGLYSKPCRTHSSSRERLWSPHFNEIRVIADMGFRGPPCPSHTVYEYQLHLDSLSSFHASQLLFATGATIVFRNECRGVYTIAFLRY